MKGLKCGGNMYVILVYDINLEEREGQKVLRNVYKICKKYALFLRTTANVLSMFFTILMT